MSVGGIGSLYRRRRSRFLWAKVSYRGKRYQISTKTTSLARARKVLAELVAKVRAGTFLGCADVGELKFDNIWEDVSATIARAANGVCER